MFIYVSNVFLTCLQRVSRQVTASLKNHDFPFELWIGILSTGGVVNAIASGALDRVTVALSRAGVPFHEWVKILKTDGAINAIAGDKFSDVVNALRVSGIRKDLWGWLLSTDGFVNSVIAGRLPTVLDHMRDRGVPESAFPQILSVCGNMNHIFDDAAHEQNGNLAKMIVMFQENSIPQDKWGSILGNTGAFNSLTQNKIPRRMAQVIKQMKKKKK